jgi:hypothetical protein
MIESASSTTFQFLPGLCHFSVRYSSASEKTHAHYTPCDRLRAGPARDGMASARHHPRFQLAPAQLGLAESWGKAFANSSSSPTLALNSAMWRRRSIKVIIGGYCPGIY